MGLVTLRAIKTLVWAGLAIAVCIGGCKVDTERETVEVQHIVMRYNQLLAEGYSKMDMTPLQAVATEEQAVKAYRHMAALGVAKTRMEAQLEDIEFLDTQFLKKDSARVLTREKWNYTHVGNEIPSQKVVQGLVYDLAYELVRSDGRWLVSSVSVLNEEKGNQKSNN